MRNYKFLVLIAFLALGFLVFAQEEGISYPIPELGDCKNKEDCMVYCDKPENMEACLDFAEAHNLISKEEIKMARRMLELGETAGPGGCRGKTECEAYCDDIAHIEECIAFAEENGLLPPEELEEGKKVAAAIKKGITPPNCRNKKECDTYCSLAENMKECLTFGEAAGLIPAEELEEAKKVLAAMEKGVKPPSCGGKEECDIYCSAPEHFEECITFAEAAGFVSPEEAVMARKTGGKGPGGCHGKEECDAYCEDQAHMEECIDFSVEYGFMSAEEAAQAKKMLAAGLTGGPGGCRGKEECDAYCNDLSHMEECVDFAVKAGFMTPEEASQAKKMAEMGVTAGPGGCKGKEECDAYCNDPTHMEECLEFGEKTGMMPPEEAAKARKGMEMMQRGGPGGCKSEEECKIYCEDSSHLEECTNFAVEQGFMSTEEAQKMLEMMKGAPPAGMPTEGMPPAGVSPEGVPAGGPPSEEMPSGIPEGMMPPEGITQPPSPEEIEKIKQQEMEKAMEQIQQMIPQGLTPPSEVPPSSPPPQQ